MFKLHGLSYLAIIGWYWSICKFSTIWKRDCQSRKEKTKTTFFGQRIGRAWRYIIMFFILVQCRAEGRRWEDPSGRNISLWVSVSWNFRPCQQESRYEDVGTDNAIVENIDKRSYRKNRNGTTGLYKKLVVVVGIIRCVLHCRLLLKFLGKHRRWTMEFHF